MSKQARLILAACLGLAALQAAPASAQNRTSFVSRYGVDGNDCSYFAPCANFTAALANTIRGGEIVCLDPTLQGSFTITKSISINCESARASIHRIGNGSSISFTTTASDFVSINGVDIVGDFDPAFFGTIVGISLNGAIARLHLRNVSVRSAVSGLVFAPTNVSQLFVKDSTFEGNGFGINFIPGSTGAANVHLSRVHVEGNSVSGIRVDGTQSTTGININVRDSLIAGTGSNGGVNAFTAAGKAPINVSITGSQISGNFAPGLKADGGGGSAIIHVGSSMISANATAIQALNGGQVRSFGTNQVNSNGGGETFTGTDFLK